MVTISREIARGRHYNIENELTILSAMVIFDITPEDIARLNDEQLRELVGRLCEAEVRQRGISAAGVTWGGNQTAADGGIDVRVSLPSTAVIDGFVPRLQTGFQVKAQDMPRAEILKEMCPKGVLRNSIQELGEAGGAYIIVSSNGSTSDSALKDRREAMAVAIAGLQDCQSLSLDFYDRTRIATWVRGQAGVIPWAREAVGRAIPGWRSYGSWACPSEPKSATYLTEDKLRIRCRTREQVPGVSVLAGITEMRNQLREPGRAVRLVGLSGVGKTRLVQALFDERIGAHSLNSSWAIYTNMADRPDPQPAELASYLIAAGARATLIVDNCPPDLHHRLADLCRQPDSRINLLTVEYDIQEDQPEGTDVFTLEAASGDLIEELIRQRFPDLSITDAQTIGEFSGGNARIGIVVASTVGKTGTVANLNDVQLFERLFFQGHHRDEDLYRAAETCALVYSFHGENISTATDAELALLANIVETSPQRLYARVAELKRRDLVQQRSVWRAVMPHAIANRLAAHALQDFPYAVIEEHLVHRAPERLLRSFSRRLGYLHTSKEAVAIVTTWLATGGFLGDVANLTDFERALFENVAPAAPLDALVALERALPASEDPPDEHPCRAHIDLLRSLAYEPALFVRAASVIASVALTETKDGRSRATTAFQSLFYLCYSGTRARLEERLEVATGLLDSVSERQRALGVLALKGALEAWQFSGMANFAFGGWSRDYGYWPQTQDEVRSWFSVTLEFAVSVACSDRPAARDVRASIAEKLNGLWHGAGIREHISEACHTIRQTCFWPEGWVAVRQILRYGKGMPSEERSQLLAIEAELRPGDVIQQVHAIVLSQTHLGLDLDNEEDDSPGDVGTRIERADMLARNLGAIVAGDETLFGAVLPVIVSGPGRLWQFGRGLSDGTSEPEKPWRKMADALSRIDETRQSPLVLGGYIYELHGRDSDLANSLLDAAVEDSTLARWYPYLQAAAGLDSIGVARVLRSLDLALTPAEEYRQLGYSHALGQTNPADLKQLLLRLAAEPSGIDPALEILHMRLHSAQKQPNTIPQELRDAGCVLLEVFPFNSNDNHRDYSVGIISRCCLQGDRGAEAASTLCRRLKEAVLSYKTHTFYNDDLLEGIFSTQPVAALEGLCAGDGRDELSRGVRLLRDLRRDKNPLSNVSDEDLLHWCDQDAVSRYPAIASVVPITERRNERLQWTSIARRLLLNAPEPSAVLTELVDQFQPRGGWQGSLAGILEAHEHLLDDLESEPGLQPAIAQEKARLRDAIATQKRYDSQRTRWQDERFE